MKCSFVFWQQLDISDEGGRYVRLYKVRNNNLIDSTCHKSLWRLVYTLTWEFFTLPPARLCGAKRQSQQICFMISVSLFLTQILFSIYFYCIVQDFIGQHPSPTSYLGSIRNETYAEPRVEHLAQIVPALKASDSFHFIPLYIQPNPSSNPASSSESVRIKIKMTNGHVFLRSFNLDDALMKLIQEVISQVGVLVVSFLSAYWKVYFLRYPNKTIRNRLTCFTIIRRNLWLHR